MEIMSASTILSAYSSNISMSTSSAASKVASRLIENRDSDDDGYLTNDEVSELSEDQFSELDTDGDGLLSSSEASSAIESQLDTMQTIVTSGASNSGSTLLALKNSAAGILMDAAKYHNASSSTDTTSTTDATDNTSTSGVLDVSV